MKTYEATQKINGEWVNIQVSENGGITYCYNDGITVRRSIGKIQMSDVNQFIKRLISEGYNVTIRTPKIYESERK
jgi:hypothetical protein